MDVKKELQTATKVVEDLSLKSIKNESLGRALTDMEICAVEWYVENILSIPRTDTLKYNNAVRNLIENGGIKHILKKYQEFCGQGFTTVLKRGGRGILKATTLCNEVITIGKAEESH